MPRVPPGSPRRILAFADWPAADQAMWQALVEPGASILDDAGPRAGWAPHSRAMKQQSYGAWLSFIGRQFPACLSLPPCARVTPDTVRPWLAEMASLLAPYTRLLRVMDLTTIVTGAAPDVDWTFLRRAVCRLEQDAVSCRGKDARVRSTAELVALGFRLMEAAQHAADARAAAVLFRDGLIIGFLALRPLRMRNLSTLEVGRTLLRTGDGHRVSIPARETKTRKRIDVPWPTALEAALQTYLAIHRPQLLGSRVPGCGAWVTCQRTIMTQHSIKLMICKRTKEAFGVSINPHLFRDCAATTVAIEDPEHIGIAACLLGHADIRTTQRFYNQASALQASGVYQDIIEKARATLRPTKRRMRRPSAR